MRLAFFDMPQFRGLCLCPRALLVVALWFWGAASHAQPSNSSPVGAHSYGFAGTPDALNATHASVQAAWKLFAERKTKQPEASASAEAFQARIRIAHNYRLARQYAEAAGEYAKVLESAAPEPLQRTVLLELAQMAQEQSDLVRAQQVYAQYLSRWPQDPEVPEVLLRQGLVFRQMSLPNLAVTKFYAVMTSALVLKPERFDYYQQLVLRAQNEIAETQYELGKYSEAVDSFSRLLKLETPPKNRSTIQYRYIQCLMALARRSEVLSQTEDFLTRYAEAPERAEVHFLRATALKQAGRNAEAQRQVLALLAEQHKPASGGAPALLYWQRRAGNEMANQFYQEGDPMKALDLYLRLAELDDTPEWQLPAWYQVGLVLERLSQPAKAIEFYSKVDARGSEAGTNAAPSLKAVVDMARWRKDFLGWQRTTEQANLAFRSMVPQPGATNAPAAPTPSKAL